MPDLAKTLTPSFVADFSKMREMLEKKLAKRRGLA
jgi:hypothetical protein